MVEKIDGIAEDVLEKLRHDPFPASLGVELVALAPGYARVSLTLDEKMTNIHNITHGGVVFTVADVALGLASNCHGPSAVAVNVNINYIRPSKPGDILTATAREEHLGRRTASYRIKVEDQQGKLVATAQGLVYRNTES